MDSETGARPTSAVSSAAQVRTLRLIFGVILMGVLLYSGSAVFLRMKGTQPPVSSGVAGWLVYSWVAVTIVVCIAGFMVASSTRSLARESGGVPSVQALTNRLVIAAALVDAGALYGVTVYLVVGFLPVLGLSILIGIFGLAITLPRTALLQDSEPTGDATVFR